MSKFENKKFVLNSYRRKPSSQEGDFDVSERELPSLHGTNNIKSLLVANPRIIYVEGSNLELESVVRNV